MLKTNILLKKGVVMASKQDNKQLLIEAISKYGFKIDRYGHYILKGKCRTYRFKMQATSVRFEKKVNVPDTGYTKAHNIWANLASDYYCNIVVGNSVLSIGKKVVNLEVIQANSNKS